MRVRADELCYKTLLSSQAFRCQRSQPKVAERASAVVCAAEAQASEGKSQGVDVASLKTGVAHYNGIRGSAFKVLYHSNV